MHSDEKTQAKSCWLAKLNEKESKLQLEINDGATYIGQIPVMTGINTDKLIEKIQKCQAQIISKTTNKMTIQIGFLTVTLNNIQSLQMLKLQQKLKQLQSKLGTSSKWEEQDLTSTAPFDIDCEYRIKLNGTYTCHCTYVCANQIGYVYTGGTYYYTGSGSRRTSSTGHAVNNIWKRRVVG